MRRIGVIVLLCMQVFVAQAAFATTSTYMTSSISTEVVTYARPATFTAILRTASGKRLANRKVTIRRNGTLFGTFNTNARGVVTTRVKHLATSTWKASFRGATGLRASSSPGRMTRAQCVANGSLAEINDTTVPLQAGRPYQFKLGSTAMFFIGSEENYEQRNQYYKDTSGDRSWWVLEVPWSTTYWVEWGASNPDTHVWIW